MLPKKSINIYPKNETNVEALLEFYFKDLNVSFDGVIDFLLVENKRLELNQIEFICRKIVDAYPNIFRVKLNGIIHLRNLFKYAIDALTVNEFRWKGSRNRNMITKEFRDFVKSTEVDISFLEKNN